MDTPRRRSPALRARPCALALASTTLAIWLIVATSGRLAASPSVTWAGFQGDAAHSGFAADGPAPPYAEAWRLPEDLAGPDAQFGLSSPIVVDGTVVTVAPDALIGADLETGAPAWRLDRDPGPSAPPAAVALGGAIAIAYTEGYGPHPPGSRASASATSTTATTTASASPSVSPSAAGGDGAEEEPVDSHLAAIDAATQEPLWKAVELDAVSSSGVTAADGVAYVGTESGSVYAVELETGDVAWTVDAGTAVDTPLVVDDGLVIATTRATRTEAPSVVALATSDGAERWRWTGDAPGYPLSAAAADDVRVYVGLADQSGTLRALDLESGALDWTARLNAPVNLVSAPAVTGDAVYALDLRGQLYRLDPATGARTWDFALNESARRSGPVVVGDHVVFGTSDGRLAAVETASGDLVFRTGAGDGQLRSLAVSTDLVVAVRGGEGAGLVAFEPDPSGTLVRVASPTVFDPAGYLGAFAVAAVLVAAVAILGGGWLLRRAGPALAVGEADEDGAAGDEIAGDEIAGDGVDDEIGDDETDEDGEP